MNENQNQDWPVRRNHRLQEYDYGQYGYCFVTVCTNHRKPLLSKIIGSDTNIPNSTSLQGLVKDFKSVTTRIYKKMYGTSESLWQESFYDEIIKTEQQYQDIWKYIDANPLMWHLDELYNE